MHQGRETDTDREASLNHIQMARWWKLQTFAVSKKKKNTDLYYTFQVHAQAKASLLEVDWKKKKPQQLSFISFATKKQT